MQINIKYFRKAFPVNMIQNAIPTCLFTYDSQEQKQLINKKTNNKIFETDKWLARTALQARHTNGQQGHEKMSNISSHDENAN